MEGMSILRQTELNEVINEVKRRSETNGGYVTYEELNQVLPQNIVDAIQSENSLRMLEALCELLGRDILGEDGEIDKSAMARKIFADPELLRQVNALVHPAVRVFLLEKLSEARKAGKPELFFVEAALLIECGYGELVDEMWYIYADAETRKSRLMQSRGYSEEKVGRIIASQLSEEAYRANSDFVIDNSGELTESFRRIDDRLSGFTKTEH